MTQQQIEKLHAGLQDAASAGWRSLEDLVLRLLKEREMLLDVAKGLLPFTAVDDAGLPELAARAALELGIRTAADATKELTDAWMTREEARVRLRALEAIKYAEGSP